MRTRNSDRAAAASERAAAAKDAARRLGFHAVGICDLAPIEREALRRWLHDGCAATMTYMHRQAARRRDPARILPGARRAVVVLERYHPGPPPPAATARVARFAWSEDYHRVLGARLAALAEVLVELGATAEATRPYVDAGPVPERELAQRAGLGWMAKNTMLIHPRHGSYTFIGSVLTDLELAVDSRFVADHCGRCRACLDACPTAALTAPRRLDARRCISYLTIERRGPFAAGEGALIGDWIFGCDLCQEACPWNSFAGPATDPRLQPRPHLMAPDPTAFAEATFAARYGDTCFSRPGSAGMQRNADWVRRNADPRPDGGGEDF